MTLLDRLIAGCFAFVAAAGFAMRHAARSMASGEWDPDLAFLALTAAAFAWIARNLGQDESARVAPAP